MKTMLYFTITKDNEFRNFLKIGTIVCTGPDGIFEIVESISTTNPPADNIKKINLKEVDWAILSRAKHDFDNPKFRQILSDAINDGTYFDGQFDQENAIENIIQAIGKYLF